MGHAGFDTYDGVSRLTTAVVQTNAVDNPTPAANTTVSQSVSYDAFGNIQAFLGSPGNSTPTDPRYNQLTGGTYDASGNLRSWNGASYDYDELNQLKHHVNGAEEWFYMYDADGERVWQFQPPIDGLARFDRWTLRGLDAKVRRTFELYGYNWTNTWGGSNLWEDYVYRGGLLLASNYSDGYQRHVDVDHLGTPRLITRTGSGQTGGFYTLTPCRILDTRQTGAPLTQTNPQRVYQISGACGVPPNALAVALNFTLVNATTNLWVQGYPGDLPTPGAPGTNVVSASPPGKVVIASATILPLATNGSGTLGVLMTLTPPATSGQTDLILDVSGYFAPPSSASATAYHAYLPFGAEATYFAQDFERMKFTGHERDLADPSSPADDLDYMHARHYNFLTGRFLSIDPGLGDETAPQELNRYSYVDGSPLKLVDPHGLDGQGTVPNYGVGEGITVFSGGARFNTADDLAFGALQYNYLLSTVGILGVFGQFRMLFYMMNPYLYHPDDQEACPPLSAGLQPCHLELKLGVILPAELAEVDATGPLGKVIAELFQTTDTVEGGTAGAIRQELRTGERVGGKFHSTKGAERARQLEKLIRSGKLNPKETGIAQRLMIDLRKALAGE